MTIKRKRRAFARWKKIHQSPHANLDEAVSSAGTDLKPNSSEENRQGSCCPEGTPSSISPSEQPPYPCTPASHTWGLCNIGAVEATPSSLPSTQINSPTYNDFDHIYSENQSEESGAGDQFHPVDYCTFSGPPPKKHPCCFPFQPPQHLICLLSLFLSVSTLYSAQLSLFMSFCLS